METIRAAVMMSIGVRAETEGFQGHLTEPDKKGGTGSALKERAARECARDRENGKPAVVVEIKRKKNKAHIAMGEKKTTV